jgi:hypothetical protein
MFTTATRKNTVTEAIFNQSEKPELLNFPDNQADFLAIIPNILSALQSMRRFTPFPLDRLYIQPLFLLPNDPGAELPLPNDPCAGLEVFVPGKSFTFSLGVLGLQAGQIPLATHLNATKIY